MTLKLGAYTACLHDRPLEAALEVLGSNGLTSVEVNTGGFIPSPHTPASTAWPSRPGTSAPPRPR
jgi:sugar phosphate isomerase/epimerase